MRVCFFGDSFVNGTGDDDALGWVGRIVASARAGGRDVTAYNLGVRRDTSADVRARWRDEAARRLPAGVDGRLVFSFGANDCVSAGDGGPRVSLAESLTNLEAILDVARSWLPTLVVGACIVADDPEATARACALSEEQARVCARRSVPYLPIAAALASSSTWAREARAGDGAHPNRGGYSEVAGLIEAWDAWRRWSSVERAGSLSQT